MRFLKRKRKCIALDLLIKWTEFIQTLSNFPQLILLDEGIFFYLPKVILGKQEISMIWCEKENPFNWTQKFCPFSWSYSIGAEASKDKEHTLWLPSYVWKILGKKLLRAYAIWWKSTNCSL